MFAPIATIALVVMSSLMVCANASSGGASTISITRFDDPVPDGCLPDDCSLREAIIAANEAEGTDHIELGPGIFTLSIEGREEDAGATGDLDITDSLILSGAGPEQTVVDADGIDRVFQIRHAFRTIEVEIRGVAAVNGFAMFSSGTESGAGGGIFVGQRATVLLQDCSVRDSRADSRAGAIFSEAGTIMGGGEPLGALTIENCEITDNEGAVGPTVVGGGGIYKRGIATIRDSIIANNDAGFTGGGGIFNAQGPLTIMSTAVFQNSAGNSGGIFTSGTAMLSLTDSIVEGNEGRVGGGGLGGGGSVQIARTTFSSNTTNEEGGALSFGGGDDLLIQDSTFSSNIAGRDGGAVFSSVDSSVEMTNVTFSGNVAGRAGGAIFLATGSMRLTNVTVKDNEAPSPESQQGSPDPSGALPPPVTPVPGGAGLYNWFGMVSSTNTLVVGNYGRSNCTGTITSLGFNLEDGMTCGFNAAGDISQALGAVVGPLASNGGPTQTHALVSGSPAIDAAGGVCPKTDQRGVVRPLDGDGDGEARCDIGAFERERAFTGDANCSGSVTAIDAALILQLSAALITDLPCFDSADVNGNGDVSALDAALVLQAVAGLIILG